MSCKHLNTHLEDFEDTDSYEYNQALGNASYGLKTYKIEVCDDCGEQIKSDG